MGDRKGGGTLGRWALAVALEKQQQRSAGLCRAGGAREPFPERGCGGAPGLWTCLGDTGMEGPLMPCEQMSCCRRHAQGPKLQECADECIHGGR